VMLRPSAMAVFGLSGDEALGRTCEDATEGSDERDMMSSSSFCSRGDS